MRSLTKNALPRRRIHTVAEERVVRDEIKDERLQLGQKVEVVFRKPVKKKIKVRPTGWPDKDYLWLLSDKEAAAGFYEAALIHRWTPFEYGLKYVSWKEKPEKGWPDLSPEQHLKRISDCSLSIQNKAKVTIYATSTITRIKKDSAHKTAKVLLSELNLEKTVKDWRNAIVHQGTRLDQHIYQVCKELIENNWANFGLNSDEWSMNPNPAKSEQ